ncbi:zinc finger MYM-type protein 2 isoform X2 [Lampris incognitus]|uniref:zinc finger MYM-type protein 2 isoform X2 n=1 Tax=Lampris incognitus TaxID=2546036 RepID=UPI0024B4F0D9|nr:zinc finger MYM-type protein 2 isoform X2 [Lampris incognitus]
MDGESASRPAVADKEAGQLEPTDAAPFTQRETTPPLDDARQAVSSVPGDETAGEGEAEDNDDDVVLVGEEVPQPNADAPSHDTPSTDCPEPTAAAATDAASVATTPSKTPSPPASSTSSAGAQRTQSVATEPIVIDDEEDSEHKVTPSAVVASPGGPSPGILSSTEPDSEIRISSVTTLGSNSQKGASSVSMSTTQPITIEPQADINLMITSVTSLQAGAAALMVAPEGQAENGLQISGAFSLSSDSSASRPTASFNPGRGPGSTAQPVQNGDTGSHARADSLISQSASFPRNQKQTGVDSPSPATSLPKPAGQSSSSSSSSSGGQPQPRTVKVTCANCKKPLKKGQTAYQRKGSTHLFCSTTCLSAFSHKPAPKKNCTMCKKDITTMKGTIVAQVDSSESFQEFCSTGCLGAYENKQNPPKSNLKTKCTVCGKLTEIRHEVSFKTVTHKICSDACFNVYRMANGLIMNCCEQCGDYLPSRATANHFLLLDGQQKRFCCQNCIRDFKQAHSKLASCVTCKTLIKTEPTCHFCKRNSLPQYQATLPEGNVLNFCSSQCVTKFQNATLQTTTNGQVPPTTNNSVQLKCNYCRGAFSLKPEILEWEDKMYQFCSKTCCEDYKKLHCIVTFCEYCQEEKTLHETVKFSGVKRPFCSEGCKLLFKQDFVKRLGLKCVTCNHCNQLCKRGVTRQLGGVTRDFCSEACAKKFNDWYYKAARCDCCKVQGNLTESVQWRAEMKQFCDQQCLLRFYCQQNDPIMVTQKGPENTSLGFDVQGAKVGLLNQGTVPYAGGGVVRDVKNKAVLCKPLTLTKATYCKPHMQSKLLQTDVDDGVKREFIPVPIPVPVFIPVPMNMYSQVTPTPVSMPVPVPVPVFLPTTLQGAEQIIQAISELKTKVPTDPLEADLLAMADIIAEDQKPDVKPAKVKKERGRGDSSLSSSSSSEEEEEEEEKYDPELDLEMDYCQAQEPVPGVEGLEEDFSLPPVLTEEKEDSSPRPWYNKQGNKRQAVEEGPIPASSSSPLSGDRHPEGHCLPLKSRYGVNAWKRWALSSTDQLEDAEGKVSPKSASDAVQSRTNLLSLTSAELCTALSRFVREVCRPNGERYAPDSILYLCLGIQQHLRAKGRDDDLFNDPCYQQFGEELNKVLRGWQPSVLPDGSLWGRVEEQSLWSSGQLGKQSPASLLRSLVYLNTKHLSLRTVEQHLRLSFANVYGPDTIHPVIKETTACTRVPSIPQELHVQMSSRKRKRKPEEDESDYDPDEGLEGSAPWCPIRQQERDIYDLYISKCSESLRERADVFYLQPEASWSPDGPVWFSSAPLEHPVLESLLTRVLIVRDIYTDKQLPKEEEAKQEEEDQDGKQEGMGSN